MKIENMKSDWSAKWIGQPGQCMIHWTNDSFPAPFFRKVFQYDGNASQAEIAICGLGYHELFINGSKVSSHVLDPVVTQYDRRVRYVTHDVRKYLRPGLNVMGVILGNGWYNCHFRHITDYDKAAWRDYPKMILELELDGVIALISDESWKTTAGPIISDGVRNGETYDARLELAGWLDKDYDDSSWLAAAIVYPPGGIIVHQEMPSCEVTNTLLPIENHQLPDGSVIYNFGCNISGWCRIFVTGDRGAEVIISSAETLLPDGDIDTARNAKYLHGGEFQTDHYILNGKGDEEWEPRFCYHGFQYVRVRCSTTVTLKKIEAREVRTAFARIGRFSCSSSIVNRLQEITDCSYRTNFIGIPSDNPGRGKHGWTGDAHLATETGLFNYAAGQAYNCWVDSIVDAQRPSGQLPGIVPTNGFGYNWGNGPAWDSALLLIPWYVYLYTGDNATIVRHYEAMKKYVNYCSGLAVGNIVSFGLGDWCHVEPTRTVEATFTSTAYYYTDALLLARFAAMTGREAEFRHYTDLADRIHSAFNRKFYRGNGIYANGEQTAMACAVYHGLCDDHEKAQVVKRLAEAVTNNNGKIDFGILGAKYVPRVLAENDYADLAFRMITQPEFPGWAWWIAQGATALWEDWNGKSGTHNHIMFGDISAWMYQYLAGITPDPENPGFKHIIIHPRPVTGLDWVNVEYDSPFGKIQVFWEKHHGKFKIDVKIPDLTTATIKLPDSGVKHVGAGEYRFDAKINTMCEKSY